MKAKSRPVSRVPLKAPPPSKTQLRVMVAVNEWFQRFKQDYLDEQPDESPQLWECGRCASSMSVVAVCDAPPHWPREPSATMLGPFLMLRCSSCLRVDLMDIGPLVASGKASAPMIGRYRATVRKRR